MSAELGDMRESEGEKAEAVRAETRSVHELYRGGRSPAQSPTGQRTGGKRQECGEQGLCPREELGSILATVGAAAGSHKGDAI